MSSDPEYMRGYMRGYALKRKQRCLDYLGGICVKCGGRDNLEIHHIDPSTKSFTIGSRWSRAWDQIQVELDKCQLLCETCHIDHHRVDNPHGVRAKYRQGCRCAECKSAHSEYQKAYKQSRRVPKEPKPIVHGTIAGYHMELRRKLTPCDSCRAANAEYTRSRRQGMGL